MSAKMRGRNRRMQSAARLYAVQALFDMEASGKPLPEVVREFEGHWIGGEIDGEALEEADVDLFRTIIREAVNWQARIDQLTNGALDPRWPITRIDPTLRALFRAAGAELVALETPARVVVNEYVEIAKAFFPPETDADGQPVRRREVGFVNAVLDHMARDARPGEFG